MNTMEMLAVLPILLVCALVPAATLILGGRVIYRGAQAGRGGVREGGSGEEILRVRVKR
jgi:hypothetical protein